MLVVTNDFWPPVVCLVKLKETKGPYSRVSGSTGHAAALMFASVLRQTTRCTPGSRSLARYWLLLKDATVWILLVFLEDGCAV